MSLITDAKTKVAKLLLNMQRFDQIMNGNEMTDVSVDVGTVPTVRKLFDYIVKNVAGIAIKGTVNTVAELPTNGNTNGDIYIIANAGANNAAGDGYIWQATNNAWKNIGPLRGPVGPQGPKGEPGNSGNIDLTAYVLKASPEFGGAPRIIVPVIDQDGVVNLDSAGGNLTGSSSAHVAFQNCLDVIANKISQGSIVGGTVRVPHGAKLRIDQTLNFTADGSINIHGGSGRNRLSATIYKYCPILFNISGESGTPGASNIGLDIGGFLIYGEYGGGTAIRAANIQQMTGHDIRYASGGGYLDYFVDGKNLSGSYFKNIYARNDHGITGPNDVQGRMFNFTATYGATDNHFHDISAQGWDYFWYAYNNSKPANEGHLFDKCTIVQCKSGIFWDAAPGFEYSPQLQFLNGHMNTYRDWVYAKNVSSVIIADSQFEVVSALTGASKVPLQLTNVLRFSLHDLFLYFSDARNNAAILIEGNSNQGLIHDIQGILTGSGQPAIVLTSGVKNTLVHHTGFYAGSGAIAFADASGNNTNYFDPNSNRILTQ